MLCTQSWRTQVTPDFQTKIFQLNSIYYSESVYGAFLQDCGNSDSSNEVIVELDFVNSDGSYLDFRFSSGLIIFPILIFISLFVLIFWIICMKIKHISFHFSHICFIIMIGFFLWYGILFFVLSMVARTHDISGSWFEPMIWIVLVSHVIEMATIIIDLLYGINDLQLDCRFWLRIYGYGIGGMLMIGELIFWIEALSPWVKLITSDYLMVAILVPVGGVWIWSMIFGFRWFVQQRFSPQEGTVQIVFVSFLAFWRLGYFGFSLSTAIGLNASNTFMSFLIPSTIVHGLAMIMVVTLLWPHSEIPPNTRVPLMSIAPLGDKPAYS
jgi:hypothetical protein